MTVALKLTHDEPKLVFLALVYHLGRPGSELDATTVQPVEHGLREVKLELGNHLFDESAVVELDERQLERLMSAMFGSVNELRIFHMRDGAESTVERFTATARDLFPVLVSEPEAALDIAESMMMLHRRVERAIRRGAAAAAPPPVQKRSGIWPFRR
jgi:hypothetical protein